LLSSGRREEPGQARHQACLPPSKENRTYDQVFGDIERGQRGPSLFRVERGKETVIPSWTLPHQGKTRLCQGRVVWPVGTPAGDARYHVLTPDNGAFVTLGKTDAQDGSFSFRGLADLSYRVEVAAMRGAKNYYWVETQIPARSAKTTVLKLRPDGSKPRNPEFFNIDW